MADLTVQMMCDAYKALQRPKPPMRLVCDYCGEVGEPYIKHAPGCPVPTLMCGEEKHG